MDFDWIVIGGGSAGYAAARTGHELGLRVAVIDGARELGGLCILRGCMPSKALLESAARARSARRARDFGLRVAGVEIDGEEIIARKRRLIDDFAGYRQGQLADGRFALYRGTARFLDAHRLQVALHDGGELELQGGAFCIATGSKIWLPPLPGLDSVPYWTSDDALDQADIPASIIVLGGGAIALELAHYYEGLGKQVTVLQRSAHVLSGMDDDVGAAAEAASRAHGITVKTGVTLESVEKYPRGIRVHYRDQHGTSSCEAERLLVALGRQPATQGLNLEAAGIHLYHKHIKIELTQQTTVPHIFAAGDVCGPFEVVHTAIAQAEIAARNAARLLGKTGSDWEKRDDRLKLYGIFTHPQVASVGLSEKDAARQNIRVVSASYPFNDHGKSMVMGEEEGFVKIIADASTKELLGAAAVGPEAVEIIHEMAVALHFRCTARQFLEIPHYHPTLSEIWTYPAEEIAAMD